MAEVGQSENDPGITNSLATTDVPSNYLICDRTGFKIPVSEGLREEWNGLKVRRESWEPRHPQDFVRGVDENQKGSPRPEGADSFQSRATLPAFSYDVLIGNSGTTYGANVELSNIYGSISPPVYKGRIIKRITYDPSVGDDIVIQMMPPSLSQDFWTSVTIGGITLESADADTFGNTGTFTVWGFDGVTIPWDSLEGTIQTVSFLPGFLPWEWDVEGQV